MEGLPRWIQVLLTFRPWVLLRRLQDCSQVSFNGLPVSIAPGVERKRRRFPMTFEDEEIEKLNLTNADDIEKLITEYLCGEKYYKSLTENNKSLLTTLQINAKKNGLNYEQFNELLLFLNQDRVNKPFFDFFFKKEKGEISLDELKKGVIRFRGFAMLCFGNFKFAYKELIQKKTEEELENRLKPFCKKRDGILEKFKARPQQMLDVKPIKRNETWYIGYISQKKFKKEDNFLRESIVSAENDKKRELLPAQKIYEEIGETIEDAERKAFENTDIYLTWDYMDVYIATSMRHKWEFQEAFDFIEDTFSDDDLTALNLRHFDPTQSKSKDRINKGLVEGLMLKRVQCSIYMAQESDTMGKDSELTATLAQGKPVIAYVPNINVDEYSEIIKGYPLDYFEKRLLILQAEEIFNDETCINVLESYDQKFSDKIVDFQKRLNDYRESEDPLKHLSLWERQEQEFKKNFIFFSDVCKILAIAEHYNFERRADTLIKSHPLAMQVDLKSGVANGVLVVRSPEECTELLRRILTNDMEFTIKHIVKEGEKEGIIVLEEKISGCPFRVVTDDEKLTNSFWNFYLDLRTNIQ